MGYELWDTASGNRIGYYASEAEALDVVADLVSRYRSRRAKRVEWLSLLRTDLPPGQGLIAKGPALAERALAAITPTPAAPTRSRKRAAGEGSRTTLT